VTALKGGLVLCAYDGQEMIGMSWAFPARCEGKWVLWSHVAGVLPAYRRLGIGAGIKWAQRVWALDNGYDQIRWTFDPLQAGNANFNLRILGATTYKIMENVYGVYDDALNPGLPTDRFETVWKLNDPRVEQLSRSETLPETPMPDATLLAYIDGAIQTGTVPESTTLGAEIPASFSQLGRENPALAREWQTALRLSLTDAFARGYSVTDFIRADGRCWYVLTR
jgi:predicted GNAT superfamily acetyltransferase